nr:MULTISPECIES: N-6 DNA methylase [unclassified Thermococcus]
MLVSLNLKFAKEIRDLLEYVTEAFNSNLNEEFLYYLEKRGVILTQKDLEKIGYFHWILEFPEVFYESKKAERRGFDIIIGNPPYGDILSDIEKRIVTRLYVVSTSEGELKGTRNAAGLFIERAFQLLRYQGYFGMIVPKSLLYIEEWGRVRALLLTKVDLRRVVDNSRAFGDVKLEMCTIIYKKSPPISEHVIVHNLYIGRLSKYSTSPTKIPRSFLTTERFITEFDENRLRLYELITSKSIRLGEISKNYRGLSLNRYVQDSLSSNDMIPIIRGKDIGRYKIRGFGYIHKKMLEKSGGFTPGDIITQRIVAHIENPVPHIELMSTIPPSSNVPNVNTVTNFKLNEKAAALGITPKYVVALLNSDILNWFVYKYIYVNAIRSMDFVGKYADQTPILIPKNEKFVKIVERMVDYILFLETLNDDSELRKITRYFKGLINAIISLGYLEEIVGNINLYSFVEYLDSKLIQIPYDRYHHLYWESTLTQQRMQEENSLDELKKEILGMIIRSYNGVVNDILVKSVLSTLKAHPLVRIFKIQ